MQPWSVRTVAVVGGSGFYGQYLVDDLLAHTELSVAVVSRRGRRLPRWGRRVSVRTADLFDRAALRAALRDVDAVAHVAGPFELMPLGPLEVALELGLPYVDVAENRRWAAATRRLIAGSPPEAPVFPGASVTPALVTMAVAWMSGRFDTVERVRTIAAPDTRKHRGNGMFRTMLHGAGRPFQQPRDRALVTVHGWTEPEWYRFPDPIGPRLVHLVFGMAELDELPVRFGAGTVEFKAGSEMVWLNRLLAVAARVRARVPAIALERLLVPVRALSWIVGQFGIDAGAVIVDVDGVRAGRARREQLAVVGEHDGGRIPVALAGVFLQRLAAGDRFAPDVVDPAAWITVEQLGVALRERGLRLLHRVDDGAWASLTTALGHSGAAG